MNKNTEIQFYASAVGMPFAIQGNKIAGWLGCVNGKDMFGWKTVKQFEKHHFPVSKLRLVTHGMPENYTKGLSATLKKANKK